MIEIKSVYQFITRFVCYRLSSCPENTERELKTEKSVSLLEIPYEMQ